MQEDEGSGRAGAKEAMYCTVHHNSKRIAMKYLKYLSILGLTTSSCWWTEQAWKLSVFSICRASFLPSIWYKHWSSYIPGISFHSLTCGHIIGTLIIHNAERSKQVDFLPSYLHISYDCARKWADSIARCSIDHRWLDRIPLSCPTMLKTLI